MIIDHNHPTYRAVWANKGLDKYNGAYYYSKEIVENIIPRVKTDRDWITIHINGVARDHSIIFVHNNLYPERYDFLKQYKDLILVCGIPETMAKVQHLGTPVYLPLSVDVEYVGQFKTAKTRDAAYVGRPEKRLGLKLPKTVDFIEGLPRPKLLERMAKYKRVYAVGRTAIEAAVLGCELEPYDPRFPDVSIWKVIDNRDAAKILQKKLDAIDKIKGV